MKPIDFCNWLRGYVEITKTERPTVDQWTQVVYQLKEVNRSDAEPANHSLQPSDFITWLKGFVEISRVSAPNETEWEIIVKALMEVFQEPKLQEVKKSEIKKVDMDDWEEIVRRTKSLPFQPPDLWKPRPPMSPWGPVYKTNEQIEKEIKEGHNGTKELPGG